VGEMGGPMPLIGHKLDTKVPSACVLVGSQVETSTVTLSGQLVADGRIKTNLAETPMVLKTDY
jgi:hypothetical protein